MEKAETEQLAALTVRHAIREFTTLLGGAAGAGPLRRAGSSQHNAVERVSQRLPSEAAHALAAFRQGLNVADTSKVKMWRSNTAGLSAARARVDRTKGCTTRMDLNFRECPSATAKPVCSKEVVRGDQRRLSEDRNYRRLQPG